MSMGSRRTTKRFTTNLNAATIKKSIEEKEKMSEINDDGKSNIEQEQKEKQEKQEEENNKSKLQTLSTSITVLPHTINKENKIETDGKSTMELQLSTLDTISTSLIESTSHTNPSLISSYNNNNNNNSKNEGKKIEQENDNTTVVPTPPLSPIINSKKRANKRMREWDSAIEPSQETNISSSISILPNTDVVCPDNTQIFTLIPNNNNSNSNNNSDKNNDTSNKNNNNNNKHNSRGGVITRRAAATLAATSPPTTFHVYTKDSLMKLERSEQLTTSIEDSKNILDTVPTETSHNNNNNNNNNGISEEVLSLPDNKKNSRRPRGVKSEIKIEKKIKEEEKEEKQEEKETNKKNENDENRKETNNINNNTDGSKKEKYEITSNTSQHNSTSTYSHTNESDKTKRGKTTTVGKKTSENAPELSFSSSSSLIQNQHNQQSQNQQNQRTGGLSAAQAMLPPPYRRNRRLKRKLHITEETKVFALHSELRDNMSQLFPRAPFSTEEDVLRSINDWREDPALLYTRLLWEFAPQEFLSRAMQRRNIINNNNNNNSSNEEEEAAAIVTTTTTKIKKEEEEESEVGNHLDPSKTH